MVLIDLTFNSFDIGKHQPPINLRDFSCRLHPSLHCQRFLELRHRNGAVLVQRLQPLVLLLEEDTLFTAFVSHPIRLFKFT